MSRDSNGTYTLPESPFAPNTVISSSVMNDNNDDIADALTDSLSRTGDGGMQAALSLDTDGIVYTSDPNTGLHSTNTDTQALFGGGVDLLTVAPTGVTIAGAMAATGAVSGAAGTFTGILSSSATSATVIATGTTAQVPAVGVGKIRFDTDLARLRISTASAFDSAVVQGDVATQAQMVTATSTTTFASPGKTQYHPGVAKAWAMCTVSGGVLTVRASYGVNTVVRNGTGNYTVQFLNAFTTAFYSAVGSLQGNLGLIVGTGGGQTTGAYITDVRDTSGSLFDPAGFSLTFFGTQV